MDIQRLSFRHLGVFKTDPTRSNNRDRTKKTNNRKKSNKKNPKKTKTKKTDWFGSVFDFEYKNRTKPNRNTITYMPYNTMKTPKCPFIPKSLMVSHSQSLTVSHSPPISHFLVSFPLPLSVTDALPLTLTHSPSPAHHPPHHRWIFTAVSPHLLLLYSSPPSSTQTPCHHRAAPSRNTTIALRHRRCTTTANATQVALCFYCSRILPMFCILLIFCSCSIVHYFLFSNSFDVLTL